MKYISIISLCISINVFCSVGLHAGCNDINRDHISIQKDVNQTVLEVEKAFITLLNWVTDYECRYRKIGSGNWITPRRDCQNINIPNVSVAECEFFLETEPGGIEYEYEVRAKCTLDGWGNWFRGTLTSYCGPNMLENNPHDIRPNELEYRDELAEEGRLSEDGGQTFFIIDNYNNDKLIFQNLDPNTRYWFKCRSRCDHNNAWTAFTPLKETRTSCNEPRVSDLFTFSANMGTHLGIRCERNANRYEFNMREKGTSQWRTSGQITDDSHVFSENVNKGDLYEFRCRIECGSEWTNYSVIVEGMIPVQCSQPISGEIGVNNVTNKSAHFYCNSGHGGGVIEKHIFRYREASESTWTEKRSDNNEADVSRLTDNSDYVMQVQHECSNGVTGGWSPAKNFKTEQSCNVNKSAFHIANISYNSAELVCEQLERDGYTWEVVRISDNRKASIPNPVIGNRYVIATLDQGEEYSVRLKVHCGSEISDWTEPLTFVTSLCLSPDPSKISISEIDNHSAVFVYDGNTQNGLEWQYRKLGNTNWRKIVTTQNEQFVDELVGNSDYEYRMRIKCSELPITYSEYSDIELFSTACESKLNRFSNITTNSITAHAIDVGVSQYIFRIRTGTSAWNEFNTNVPQYSFVQLSPNTQYEIQLKAMCNGQGIWSSSSFISTEENMPTQCNAPLRSQLGKSNVTPISAELNCNKGNVDGFIFRYSSGNGWIESGLITQGSYIASNLSQATIYGFQCRVKCGPNFSNWSDTVYFRTLSQTFALSAACPPPYIYEILPANIGVNNGVLFCFSEADQYQFRYRDSADIDWIETPAQSSNRIIVNQLKPNTTYEFQCKLFCNGNFGTYSSPKYFKTLSSTECFAPSIDNFHAVQIKKNEANLISLNQARLYRFRYKTIGESDWIYTDTSSTPNVIIDQLKPATHYIVQIQTMCLNQKISGYSKSKFFKTLDACDADTANDVSIKFLNDSTISFFTNRRNIASMFIRYRESGQKEWTSIYSFSWGEWVPPQIIKPGKKYEMQTLVYCTDRNNSQWSASKFFTSDGISNQSDEIQEQWSVYPNPVNGHLIIQAPVFANFTISNVVGELVYKGKMSAGYEKINMEFLKNGMYFISLETGKIILLKSFIKLD